MRSRSTDIAKGIFNICSVVMPNEYLISRDGASKFLEETVDRSLVPSLPGRAQETGLCYLPLIPRYTVLNL